MGELLRIRRGRRDVVERGAAGTLVGCEAKTGDATLRVAGGGPRWLVAGIMAAEGNRRPEAG